MLMIIGLILGIISISSNIAIVINMIKNNCKNFWVNLGIATIAAVLCYACIALYMKIKRDAIKRAKVEEKVSHYQLVSLTPSQFSYCYETEKGTTKVITKMIESENVDFKKSDAWVVESHEYTEQYNIWEFLFTFGKKKKHEYYIVYVS